MIGHNTIVFVMHFQKKRKKVIEIIDHMVIIQITGLSKDSYFGTRGVLGAKLVCLSVLVVSIVNRY